jgi:hypothetical protein
MGSVGRSERLLFRVEAEISEALASGDRCVLSFSGGVGSLLVGAIARKHTDLTCIVLSVDHAKDREAAALAQKFLDYRVRFMDLTAREALQAAREIVVGHPDLSVAEVMALVPLKAAFDSDPEALFLAGFWSDLPSSLVRRSIKTPRVRLPLSRATGQRPVRRVDLVAMGRLLDIPEAFLQVPSRSPAVGSGLGAALRALAREKQTTVTHLIRS